MPYVSAKQRRFFNANRGGKISESTVDEFNEETKGKKLPEEAPSKKKGGLAAWAKKRAG